MCLAVRRPARAIGLEPVFARPYFVLGQLYDHARFSEDALLQYQAYLQQCVLDMREREWVAQCVMQLSSSAP